MIVESKTCLAPRDGKCPDDFQNKLSSITDDKYGSIVCSVFRYDSFKHDEKGTLAQL